MKWVCLALLMAIATLRGFAHAWIKMQVGRRLDVSKILESPQFPPIFPFRPNDFSRQDESNDSAFYQDSRLVYHIDNGAIKALTQYYSDNFKPSDDVLDICSSWVSHYPKDLKLGRVAGIGMNQFELKNNKQLTEYKVQDLNMNPILPYPDNSFDYVTCCVSADYLIRPLEVFSEVKRVLKKGGSFIVSQSNRCFPTKAINIWLQTNDYEHIFIIGSYFHYTGGYTKLQSSQLHTTEIDPMYIIRASKL